MAGGRHRGRWILLAVVVGVAALVAGGLVLLDARAPGPASVSDAVRDFNGGGGGSSSGTRPRPPEGVYVYDGTGTESLSILPGSHAQGPQLPATLTHRAHGCWTFRIDYHEDHWQDWRYCPNGEDLVETGGRTYQAWDLGIAAVGNTSTFHCPDSVVIRAGAEPGDRWHQECDGTSDTVSGTTVSAGPYRFVGEDSVRVDGDDIAALRYHQVRRMSGAQSGRQEEEFWFRASDGLPLRERRSSSVDSQSPVGSITYTEDGSWQLRSTVPRT